MIDAYKEGSLAYQNGQHKWENPYNDYPDDDMQHFLWWDGWRDAEEMYLEEMDGKED